MADQRAENVEASYLAEFGGQRQSLIFQGFSAMQAINCLRKNCPKKVFSKKLAAHSFHAPHEMLEVSSAAGRGCLNRLFDIVNLYQDQPGDAVGAPGPPSIAWMEAGSRRRR
jgi:hypothetical protein